MAAGSQREANCFARGRLAPINIRLARSEPYSLSPYSSTSRPVRPTSALSPPLGRAQERGI